MSFDDSEPFFANYVYKNSQNVISVLTYMQPTIMTFSVRQQSANNDILSKL